MFDSQSRHCFLIFFRNFEIEILRENSFIFEYNTVAMVCDGMQWFEFKITLIGVTFINGINTLNFELGELFTIIVDEVFDRKASTFLVLRHPGCVIFEPLKALFFMRIFELICWQNTRRTAPPVLRLIRSFIIFGICSLQIVNSPLSNSLPQS